MTGISQWTANTALASPTSGSRLPTLQVLNQAFATQSDLGWGACLRGLLSTHWETSFRATYRPTKPLKPTQLQVVTDRWLRLVTSALWTFSEKVWRHRNQVVYGCTEEFKVSQATRLLRDRVSALYKQFQADQHLLPASRQYLFNRPLISIQAMDTDGMSSWIRSVEEGIRTREDREKLHQQNAHQTLHHYFRRVQPQSKPSAGKTSSLWTPPFTKVYYHRTGQNPLPPKRLALRRPRKSPALASSTKTKIRTKAVAVKMKPLHDFGFCRRSNNDGSPSLIRKSTKQLDYSGTFVSTAP